MMAETGSEVWKGRARDKLGEGIYKPLMQIQIVLQLASSAQVRSQERGPRFPRMKRQGHTNRLTDSGGVRQPSVGQGPGKATEDRTQSLGFGQATPSISDLRGEMEEASPPSGSQDI